MSGLSSPSGVDLGMAGVASTASGGGESPLTLTEAARIVREATKDKSYRKYPLGQEAGTYLRRKRGSITTSTYRDYESCLDKLARWGADLKIEAFVLPRGRELAEEFLDHYWGNQSPRTYNKNLSIIRDFFEDAVDRGKLVVNPAAKIKRHKQRDVRREKFNELLVVRILEKGPDPANETRDRLALRLLLRYGLRKGALAAIRFEHFDVERQRLTIFTKGQKIREVRIVNVQFWADLTDLRFHLEALPTHYLMAGRKQIWRGYTEDGGSKFEVKQYPERPMSDHGLHDWWYGCLTRAGIVPAGTTSGKKMHSARYTAGQRILDVTGNIKAVQKALHHVDPATTMEHYADWDDAQLEGTMRDVDV